jgi:hypothetical protein
VTALREAIRKLDLKASARELWKRKILALPWITVEKEAGPCQGYKASLSAKHRREGKFLCQVPAHYRYVFDEPQPLGNKDALLCWHHLLARGVMGDMHEEWRARDWWRSNGYNETPWEA